MASTDDVLLRLVIKGMDPAEVKRLADATYGQLRVEAAKHIDELAKLHRQKSEEMTADTKKRVEEQIKAETKALSALQQVMRQQEIAANQTHNAWRRTMEDLENVTTVARGVFDVIAGGFERFKHMSEEVIKINQVMNAGNAGGMGLLSGIVGNISEYDLVTSKNQQMIAGLKITDGEFQTLAESAGHFSDVLGTDAKSALDSLTDAMITGRTKGIARMIGVIDQQKAEEDYAKSIHTSVAALTQEQKIHVTQMEILDRLRGKLDTVGDAQENAAQKLESTFTKITNLWNSLLRSIGDSEALRAVIGAVSDPLSVRVPGALARMMREGHFQTKDETEAAGNSADAGFEANMKQWKKEAAIKASHEKDKAGPGYFPFGEYEDNVGQRDHQTQEHIDAEKAKDFDEKYTEFYQADMDKRNEADAKRYIALEKSKGISIDAGMAYEKLAESLGVETAALSQDQKMQALATEAQIKAAELAEQMEKAADERRAQLKETGKKAGFLGVFLFGPDGPEETYKEMTTAMQFVTDSFGEMSDMLGASAKRMSDAMAKSLTALVSGSGASRVSMRQVTHDMLENLSTQAFSRALFETAEGLASLALGPIGGVSAGMHFAAAAAFGGVGIAAGLGARAVGVPSVSSASATSRTTGVTSSATSSFGSGGQRSVGVGGDSRPPVVINLNGVIGGAETGRAVKKALEEYQNLTGEQLIGQAA